MHGRHALDSRPLHQGLRYQTKRGKFMSSSPNKGTTCQSRTVPSCKRGYSGILLAFKGVVRVPSSWYIPALGNFGTSSCIRNSTYQTFPVLDTLLYLHRCRVRHSLPAPQAHTSVFYCRDRYECSGTPAGSKGYNRWTLIKTILTRAPEQS